MNDSELNQILKCARTPGRSSEYWDEFPSRVTHELRRSAAHSMRTPGSKRPFFPRSAFGLSIGFAVVCLLVGFWLGQRNHVGNLRTDTTPAEAQKFYRETVQLFPNQIRAIVFDQKGTHLVLAERADVSESLPVFMKICGPQGCQAVVTFSGQQIKIGGKPVDVLVGPRGEVILAGPDSLWSSNQKANQIGEYRIKAEALHTSL